MKKLLALFLLVCSVASAQYGPINFGGGSGGSTPFTGGTLTQNLTMSDGTIVELATGSESNLALRFRNTPTTGFFIPTANVLRLRLGGNHGFQLTQSGLNSFGGNSKTVGYGGNYFGGYASGGDYSTSVGHAAGRSMTGELNIAIGHSAGDYNNGTALGITKSIAIGIFAMTASQAANVSNAVSIGAHTYTTASNQVVIGSSTVTDFQLGQGGTLARFETATATININGSPAIRVASSGTQIFQPLTYPYYTASSTTPVATTTYYTTGWSFTADGIIVDIGGVIQSGGGIDYTETPPNLITFASEVATGSRVTIRNR